MSIKKIYTIPMRLSEFIGPPGVSTDPAVTKAAYDDWANSLVEVEVTKRQYDAYVASLKAKADEMGTILPLMDGAL